MQRAAGPGIEVEICPMGKENLRFVCIDLGNNARCQTKCGAACPQQRGEPLFRDQIGVCQNPRDLFPECCHLRGSNLLAGIC